MTLPGNHWKRVDDQSKIICEEQVSDDGVEIDDDNGEYGSEENGLVVPENTVDHVHQRVVAIDYINQLCVGVCVWVCDSCMVDSSFKINL